MLKEEISISIVIRHKTNFMAQIANIIIYKKNIIIIIILITNAEIKATLLQTNAAVTLYGTLQRTHLTRLQL